MKKNQGFTVIELLVGIGIIVFISVILLANYKSSSRQINLNMAAQQIASEIRLAQGYALGLQEFQNNIPKGGWAVHFAAGADRYTIFADLNGNGLVVEDSATEKMKDIILPEDLVLDNFSSSDAINCPGALNQGTIFFIPPDPRIVIKSDFGTCNQIDIIARDINAGDTRNIDINFLGLIEVE